MKFNKKLAASVLSVIMALISTNLPLLAADNDAVTETSIEESVIDEADLQEEITDGEARTSEEIEEVSENEADALEDTGEISENSEDVDGTVVTFGDYSLVIDESTGRITGYIDNVEPIYSNGILKNPVDLVIPSNIEGTDITGIDDEVFMDRERIRSVTIENGIEYIGVSAFEDCVNIETLFVPNTVTYIDEYAFYGASSLEEVDFEENSNLAVISWMTFASTGLYEVTIPESVTNIHEKAFRNCKNLTKVYFEGNAPQNLEEDENAFSYCNSDLILYYYEGKTGYKNPEWIGHKCLMISMRTSDYGLVLDKSTGRIMGYIDKINPIYSNGRIQNSIDLVIPNNIDGTDITGIDNEAFMGWERLGSVTIESGIEYIGVSAFEECFNIETVFIPNTVTCIDECAFLKTAFLEKVDIEENSHLKTIGCKAFARSGLKEIVIPESVISINERAFIICDDLKKVYFEGDAPQDINEDKYVFAACDPDLVIYFYEGKTGYTTPTWLGYKCVMIGTGIETDIWNFSDASLNSLGTITSNVELGNITILADNTNSVQVKENPRTLNGVTYDYCLSLRGKGTTDYRAVKLDVTRNCTISVAAASNSDTRNLKVVKSDGTVLGTIAAGQKLSIGSVEYKGKADSVYLYSEKDNVNIYSINVSYN